MGDDVRRIEYEALRSTIRERGSVRMCAILGGLVAWGALSLALSAANLDRAATLVPLLALTAAFEVSFFLHMGVERIGRYLQVFFEEEKPGHWETTAMAYGRSFPGGLDPLFSTLFGAAAAVDFLCSFLAAVRHPGWAVISLAAHVAFGGRIFAARRLSAGQRALDLERFRTLKNASSSN